MLKTSLNGHLNRAMTFQFGPRGLEVTDSFSSTSARLTECSILQRYSSCYSFCEDNFNSELHCVSVAQAGDVCAFSLTAVLAMDVSLE
jgi:hypothetical protein